MLIMTAQRAITSGTIQAMPAGFNHSFILCAGVGAGLGRIVALHH